DIVKTVYRELLLGQDENFRIPDRADSVAQTLITYQNSHRPQDLWHFVTPDYRQLALWVQLKSGDNRDMLQVVEHAERFLAENPPPVPLDPQWFGLTYINVVWQQKMVAGMANAFLGSFVVVFLTMTLLFRSVLWGLLSMIPLSVTIALIYGVIGIVGKDYDMPVAVLSSLTLGLAIDFAIHFLARARELHPKGGSWAGTVPLVFGEPGRAIARNVIVIAVGFSPLLVAPLVPYRTVGMLMASILVVSGIATLVILPALIGLAERWLFRGKEAR
ncbi:MAG: MMPL family transporter, partial [Myxococcota bacterium]